MCMCYDCISYDIMNYSVETIEMIQSDNAPQTTEKPQAAVPPVRPPHKYLPFHPACKSSYNAQ